MKTKHSLIATALVVLAFLPTQAKAQTVMDFPQFISSIMSTVAEVKQTVEKVKAMKNMDYNSIMNGLKGINRSIDCMNHNIGQANGFINESMKPNVPVQIGNPQDPVEVTDFVKTDIRAEVKTPAEIAAKKDISDALNQISAVSSYGKALGSRKVAEDFDAEMEALFEAATSAPVGDDAEGKDDRAFLTEHLQPITGQLLVQLSQINLMHALMVEMKATKIVTSSTGL